MNNTFWFIPYASINDTTKSATIAMDVYFAWSVPPALPAVPPDRIYGDSRGHTYYGTIDGIDNKTVHGWAFRRDDVSPNNLNQVVVYADYDVVADGQSHCTNGQQPDENALEEHGQVTSDTRTANWGFSFAIPSSLQDGLEHQVTACMHDGAPITTGKPTGGIAILGSPAKFRVGITPSMIEAVLSSLE